MEARPGVEPRFTDLQSAAWPLCQRAFVSVSILADGARAGLEPARLESRGILNPLCLPISPPGQRKLRYGNTICSFGLCPENEAYFTVFLSKVNKKM